MTQAAEGDINIESDGSLSAEEIEEMKVIAREVISQEDAGTQAAANQAILDHYKNRVVATRIQMEMLNRKNIALEEEIATLKNQLAQARRRKTPAKKSTTSRKK